MTRFEKPDTPGKFNSVIAFIKCLDQASIDVACQNRGLNEADFRAMIHEHNLIEEKAVLDIFTRMANEINKHLEHGSDAQLLLNKQLTVTDNDGK